MTSARILIVDDNADIGALTATVLTEAGFEAVVVENASSAIGLLGGTAFDILVTDVRMPDLNGIELAARALKVSPAIRIVFMSGYMAEHEVDLSREYFLEKPFRPTQLLQCIRQVLEDAAAARPR